MKLKPIKVNFPKQKTSKRLPLKWFLPIFAILMIIFLPLSGLAVSSFIGLRQLKQTHQSLLSADLTTAKISAQTAKTSLETAEKLFSVYSLGLNLLGQERLALRLEKLFLVGGEVADGVVGLVNLSESAAAAGKIVFQNQPGDIEDYLREINREADQVYRNFSTAQAVAESEKSLLPTDIPFEKINELLDISRQALPVVPELLGLNGKRTYLVLFQNNMELRPTGGFIGSYGLVTFDKGKMIDFEVNDVYAADGQLKGHVEPPAEIKKYLGEAGWFLRDSNWHPDFPVSAQRAEWFLEKETGRTVDGVIGLNLYLVQDILSRVGELELPDFQENIDAKNLFERAEYHSEVNFFPGSTQKSDFLSSLARALLEKVKTADEDVWLAVAESVWQSLREKDLLMAMHDPVSVDLIFRQGWDGRLGQIACYSEEEAACFIDYLMVNEANVGVNKANYFVQRKISQNLEIASDGRISKTLRILYQNQSPSENFPAGRYKNYLRIIVPPGSAVESVLVDNEPLQSADIEIQEVSDKESIGFLVEVPIRSERVVEIRYSLAEPINLDRATKYLLYWQKQSGIRDDQVEFIMSASPGVALFEPQPPGKKSKFFDEKTGESRETLTFTSGLTEDLVFEVGVIR